MSRKLAPSITSWTGTAPSRRRICFPQPGQDLLVRFYAIYVVKMKSLTKVIVMQVDYCICAYTNVSPTLLSMDPSAAANKIQTRPLANHHELISCTIYSKSSLFNLTSPRAV